MFKKPWMMMVAAATLFAIAGQVAAADAAQVTEKCANCHGKDGVSTDKEVPTIAGYSEAYIGDTLAAYKKKSRPCPETKYRDGPDKGKTTDMCAVANDLSDAGAKDAGKFFAGKKFVRAQQSADPALAAKGKEIHEQSCEKCHTDAGSKASDDSGILAGQWMPYLKQTLGEFKSGARPMTKKMKPKIDALAPGDLDALANFYGSFK